MENNTNNQVTVVQVTVVQDDKQTNGKQQELLVAFVSVGALDFDPLFMES